MSNSVDLPYEYRKLAHTDSIRLLKLHPASDPSSPICCSLRHTRLSQHRKYEAISYTWGDDTALCPIYLCDGNRGQLQVRSNCYNVLRHVRLADRPRMLWIDAICIDQANSQERGHQVKSMDRIYEQASAVVAYLGEETLGSRILFEELAKADETRSKIGECNRPPPSDIIVAELNNLIRRPWFRRVWVLQEVSTNAITYFMCGSARTSMEALHACLHGYSDTLVTESDRPLPFDIKFLSCSQPMRASSSLWEYLVRSKNCLATDPRDRIFALRSLIPPEHRADMDDLIKYERSVEHTFIETALFLINGIGLQLLIAIRHCHNLTIPSWVPDFSKISLLDVARSGIYHLVSRTLEKETEHSFRDPDFFAVDLRLQNDSEELKLHVTGIRYATICHSTSPFLFNDNEDADMQIDKLCRQICEWKSLAETSTGKVDIPDVYPLDSKILQAMQLRSEDSIKRELGRDESRTLCRGWLYQCLQGCKLVLMDNDGLAIAPEAARAGDVICIFQGGQSPCILRSHQENYWKLISGDCHIFDGDYLLSETEDSVFPYAEFCEGIEEDMEVFTIC